MTMRAAVPVLAALMMTPVVWAQGGGATAPAPTKVGVINIQAAIASTAEGKQAAAELQSRFAPRTTELENIRKEIEDLQTRLRTGQTTLSDAEKARLSRRGDQLTRTFQRKQQDFQDDTNEAQQDVVGQIGRKLIGVMDKYSKDHGYSIILDTSSQQTPVLYAANQVDITQDIIRLYDQNYPVKSAATPAKPAATPKPKPAPARKP
jgi:outer membrane protein